MSGDQAGVFISTHFTPGPRDFLPDCGQKSTIWAGQRKEPRLRRSDSSGKARSPVYYVKSEDETWQVAHILERRCEAMVRSAEGDSQPLG